MELPIREEVYVKSEITSDEFQDNITENVSKQYPISARIKQEQSCAELQSEEHHLKMSNNKRVVHSQGREIIYNVYKFMKLEKEQGHLVMPLNRLQERVAIATGVGLNTVKRIIKEGVGKPEGSRFTSPRRTINKPNPKCTVDQIEEEIIRNVIYSYASIHNERNPTMQAVFEAVKNKEGVNFKGKLSSFRRLVRNMGFRWKKTQDNRKVLVEKSDMDDEADFCLSSDDEDRNSN